MTHRVLLSTQENIFGLWDVCAGEGLRPLYSNWSAVVSCACRFFVSCSVWLEPHVRTPNGPRWLSRCSDSLWAGLSGDGIAVGQYFPYPSRPALGPTQTSMQWVPGPSLITVRYAKLVCLKCKSEQNFMSLCCWGYERECSASGLCGCRIVLYAWGCANTSRPLISENFAGMMLRLCINTVMPRLTKIIRSGITFVSRNLR